MARRKRCLSRGKTCGPAVTRGVCHTCYMVYWRRVGRGLATWEELERMKLVLPRSVKSPALERLRKAQRR